MSGRIGSRWVWSTVIITVLGLPRALRADEPAAIERAEPATKPAEAEAKAKSELETRIKEAYRQIQRDLAEIERLSRDSESQFAAKIADSERQVERYRLQAQEAMQEAAKARAELIATLKDAATQPAAEDFKLEVSRQQAQFEALRKENAADIEALHAANLRQKREIEELKNKLEVLAGGAAVNPVAPIPAAAKIDPPANPANLPPAKIRARRNINGVEYATVSLGAVNHVEKGMRMRVVDGDEFLGHLIIDLVEQDESVGHLEGPKIEKIKKGSDVKG
jgi:hypothetical protein